MVLLPAIEDDKPTYVERETAAAENANLEEITGVYPQVTVANTT